MNRPTTVLDSLTISGDSAISRAVAERADIFAMTQTAEDAVLRPVQAGGWGHELRHALAARIAAHNGLPDLAAHYAAGAGGDMQMLCDPAHLPDGELRIVTEFMDDVACNPRDVTAVEVTRLQEAGIADADIVRLAELNAFMAYHCRLIAGLKLMAENDV